MIYEELIKPIITTGILFLAIWALLYLFTKSPYTPVFKEETATTAFLWALFAALVWLF